MLLYQTRTAARSVLRLRGVSVRLNSSAPQQPKLVHEITKPKIYIYPEIKKLAEQDPASTSKILVDVREPAEYAKYAIPHAINVPYISSPGAWDLEPDKFKEIFGVDKPDKEKNELIFYCVAGVRSAAAAELAAMSGYKHLGNYVGSLKDWLQNEHVELAPAAPPAKDE